MTIYNIRFFWLMHFGGAIYLILLRNLSLIRLTLISLKI